MNKQQQLGNPNYTQSQYKHNIVRGYQSLPRIDMHNNYETFKYIKPFILLMEFTHTNC